MMRFVTSVTSWSVLVSSYSFLIEDQTRENGGNQPSHGQEISIAKATFDFAISASKSSDSSSALMPSLWGQSSFLDRNFRLLANQLATGQFFFSHVALVLHCQCCLSQLGVRLLMDL